MKIKLKHPPKIKKENPFLAMLVLFSITFSLSLIQSPYNAIISLTIVCSDSSFAPSSIKKEGFGVVEAFLKLCALIKKPIEIKYNPNEIINNIIILKDTLSVFDIIVVNNEDCIVKIIANTAIIELIFESID